jgi:ribosomal protein S18 acetylase RimI-like enzyme
MINIRPCIKDDLKQCEAIFNLPELSDTTGDNLSAKYLENFLDEKYFLVAEEENKVLGAIYGEPLKTDGVMLWSIAVLSSCRGKGTGHSLLEAFEKNAIADKKKWIILHAPAEKEATIDFYKKHNYTMGNNFTEFAKDL